LSLLSKLSRRVLVYIAQPDENDVADSENIISPPPWPDCGMSAHERSGLGALGDLKVVELGVWVAAPGAAALLADWGADVVKVESPAGDPMRYVFESLGIGADGANPAFALDNRGKRSVALDLRDASDRQHLEDLLDWADVFVSNLRLDALDRLDLEPAKTVARHPRLVYCSVSGFGLRGEERNRPIYDIGAFWARSGLSVQMADTEGVPLNARGGIGDHITALAAVSGLLAAVLEQRTSGKGQVVEVSLLRTGAYVLGWDLGLQMTLGKVAPSEPRSNNQAPLMNPYRAGDGRWFFFTGLEIERHIPAVCRALGRPDLLEDPRFESASAMRRNRSEVIALLDGIIAERPLDEWAARFDREGVWWAPAQTPAEVVADPQLVANGGFVEIPSRAGPTQRSVNGPVTFSGAGAARPGPVPALGEHTDEVLREVGGRSAPGRRPGDPSSA
jgi:crotonobetainyl-CoA:carnitine CoA-transferase CaiB-like acyl-CoA transferase